MAFNDIYRLVIHQRLHGQEVINKLHFVQELLDPGNIAQNLANEFRTQMDTTMRARAQADLKFEYVEAQRIVPFGDGPAISSWPANTAGSIASGFCPTGMVSEVITVFSTGAGRRKRGRIYLSGVQASGMLAGQFTAAQTTLTTAFATAMATRYITMPRVGGFALGVWSRKTAGPIPPWSTDAFTIASGLTVRTIMRTQRRRQLGVGR